MDDDFISRKGTAEAIEGLPFNMSFALNKDELNGMNRAKVVIAHYILSSIPAADVVERPRWIPVDERLPRGGENVLAYYHNPYNQFIVCATWDSKRQEWIPDLESIDGYYITAWMPLPEPPKNEVSE